MTELAKLGKIKVETELVDLGYQVVKATNGQPVVIVDFTLKKAISPEEAADVAQLIRAFIAEFVKPNVPDNAKLYALSGRGPIWLYAMAIHAIGHNVPALGVFDPKIGKAGAVVVVAVHAYGVELNEGQVVELEPKEAAKLTQ